MNKVTRADVDVQPYAFTTKALFVGHMDHRFLRWQVVDTPGILDRPLEERNTIEMQAITALAHLQCCVLYFLDISEQCGYTLENQLKLFESIRPLFANKQVMLVANKTDVIPYTDLPLRSRNMIEEAARASNAELIPMSNISEENVSALKIRACDKLLEARVDAKLAAGRMKDDVLSRITVAIPKPRDDQKREAYIPESVRSVMDGNAMSTDAGRMTEKELMISNGGAGVYVCDYRKYYLLEEDEWRYDTIPEFMDGKNVMDFFDADIENRLRRLDEEEAELEAQGAYAPEEDDENDLDEEEMLLYGLIRDKQSIARAHSKENTKRVPRKFALRGRTAEDIHEELESKGLESEGVIEHSRGRKRGRSVGGSVKDDDMEIDRDASVSKRRRGQSATKGPTATSVPPSQLKQVTKSKRTLDRALVRYARGGEADRMHYPKLVKHLNSGKRSLGTSTIGR